MSKSLSGKVCLVTGATRGIGKGIALQLGQAGGTVYITERYFIVLKNLPGRYQVLMKTVTGRTLTTDKSDPIGGSLTDTANEIEKRGGTCIPVQCDHSKDSDVEELFDRISKEQDGRLDVLVNNAFNTAQGLKENMGQPFWEQPITMWDAVNNVGLRNHYICSVHAAKLMTARKKGLIVNISSMGGLQYTFSVPYGVGKEALDRMAADCAVELRASNVAFVSLWPGAVRTEFFTHMVKTQTADGFFNAGRAENEPKLDCSIIYSIALSTEYEGKAVVALATDLNIMKKSGKILMTADLGYEYGFKDVDGREPMNIRQLSTLMQMNPKTRWLTNIVPNFIYLPKWMLALSGNKF